MDKQDVGPALGKIVSGIYILTAKHASNETGMLASWVQQAGFDPPAITVAIKKGRYVVDWITDGAPYVVNVLSDENKQMLAHFGKGFPEGDPAFESLLIRRSNQGIALLSSALAHIECQVISQLESSDHHIFLAEVVSGALQNEGTPMTHVRKNGFHY